MSDKAKPFLSPAVRVDVLREIQDLSLKVSRLAATIEEIRGRVPSYYAASRAWYGLEEAQRWIDDDGALKP